MAFAIKLQIQNLSNKVCFSLSFGMYIRKVFASHFYIKNHGPDGTNQLKGLTQKSLIFFNVPTFYLPYFFNHPINLTIHLYTYLSKYLI
jgi:hypothetical protein